MTQLANNSAQQSASAMANARWHRMATPGGPDHAVPDHALPGHALDAAHVSSHARLLAQRRWGTPSAGETSAGTAGNSQRHAHASADACAAAPKSPAGNPGWLPWPAVGGSIAALIGAEIERRRASDAAIGNPAEAGIPFTAILLYLLAAALAALALYLLLCRS